MLCCQMLGVEPLLVSHLSRSSLSLSDISALTGGRPTPIGGHSILVSDATAADEMRRDMRRQSALFQERDEEARHQRQLLERKLQHTQQRHAAELNALRAKLMQVKKQAAHITIPSYKAQRGRFDRCLFFRESGAWPVCGGVGQAEAGGFFPP